jgi:hypothetical protein
MARETVGVLAAHGGGGGDDLQVGLLAVGDQGLVEAARRDLEIDGVVEVGGHGRRRQRNTGQRGRAEKKLRPGFHDLPPLIAALPRLCWG